MASWYKHGTVPVVRVQSLGLPVVTDGRCTCICTGKFALKQMQLYTALHGRHKSFPFTSSHVLADKHNNYYIWPKCQNHITVYTTELPSMYHCQLLKVDPQATHLLQYLIVYRALLFTVTYDQQLETNKLF